MKLIITTVSPDMDSLVDPRFGRSPYFLIVDSNTLNWRAVPNPGGASPGGAGVAAAQYAVNEKVDAVISGNFGPNAANALKAAGISVHSFGACRTAREVCDQWKAGKLALA